MSATIPPPPAARRRRARVPLLALAGAALGATGMVAGVLTDPRRAAFAWLAAFASALSIVLGMIALVMIAHVTRAQWFVVVRRLAELAAGATPLFLLLFLPIVAALDLLYPWVPPLADLEPQARELIDRRRAYLNVPFWLVRAALYLATWTILAWRLRRWSFRQDENPESAPERAAQRIGAPGLIALGFTLTFAAIDWIMALSAEWQSTVFGIYWFAGGFLSAIALLVVVVAVAREPEDERHAVSEYHVHALGRLLLAFTIFWAYIAFAQGFLMWIADLPHEAAWYLDRSEGGWGYVLLLLGLGHFVVPFAALLSRSLKQNLRALTGIAVLLLFMHLVDTFWLVIPALAGGHPVVHWLDASAVLAVYGAAIAFAAWRAAGRPLLARNDPRFVDAVKYYSP